MVDTYTIDDADEFASTVADLDLNQRQLSDDAFTDLWDLWELRTELFGPCLLVAVPEWFSKEEFGATRPFMFTQVEHDDASSGAVLFSDAQLIDVSIVRGGHVDAVADADNELTFSRTVTELDISSEDDYIDESGKVWIPRSLLTAFEYGPAQQSETADPDADGATDGRPDPSSITGGVLGS